MTGGGALAGFHTGHRQTEDLNLFFPGLSVLTHQSRDVEYLLAAAGIPIARLQTSPAFQRLAAQTDSQTVRIDLVADVVPRI